MNNEVKDILEKAYRQDDLMDSISLYLCKICLYPIMGMLLALATGKM